jgi:tetratricopeptide (TPR) repeat protein
LRASNSLLLAVKKFDEALSKTGVDVTLKNSIFDAKAAALNEWGNTLVKIDDFDDAIKKFEEAMNLTTNAKMKSKYELNMKRLKARKLSDEAQDVWEQGWEEEEEGDVDQATESFKKAQKLFTKAFAIDNVNQENKHWIQMCNLKLEGNQIFNQAFKLQKQANLLQCDGKYQEALRKYQQAENHFLEGFEHSKDMKFKACVDFVKTSIEKLEKITNNLKENLKAKQQNHHDESDEEEIRMPGKTYASI